MKEDTQLTGKVLAEGGCAFYRPEGWAKLEPMTQALVEAISFCAEQRIPKLFANISAVEGFPSPTLAERYFIARRLAAAGRNLVQLSLVVRPEMIDPEKFGITVARNSGMNADVFPAEPEALAWLLGPSTSSDKRV